VRTPQVGLTSHLAVADDGPGACGLLPARRARAGRLRGGPALRSVLVGYLAGLALIMIAGQLARVTGVEVSGRTFSAHVISFVTRIGSDQPASGAVAAAVLVFLFVVRARWPAAARPAARDAAGIGRGGCRRPESP